MSSSTPIAAHTPVRILIINPNTTTSMTTLLGPLISSLSIPSNLLTTTFFTCPSPGIASINSPTDSQLSGEHCLPHLLPLLPSHDAFLIACYSAHPLVPALQSECDKLVPRKYVTGIFEASVLTSLSLLRSTQSFGIVSTGAIWSTALPSAVQDFLGTSSSPHPSFSRFLSCETTGLNATDLHNLPANEVSLKMVEATKHLVRNGQASGREVGAICLGCAGMVGLDDAVRAACLEELGEEKGARVHIVDGVKAGVLQLFAMARGGF